MRILHVTDLHFHLPWFHWLSDHACDYDAVALSGDLLSYLHPQSTEQQIEWVRRWLRRTPAPFVVCSGNHDLDEPPDCHWLPRWSGEQLTTDRQVSRLGDWTFEAVPFGEVPLHGGENHIVVTHLPPAGAPTAQLRSPAVDCGDEHFANHLRTMSAKPRLILSGHVHRPRSWQARAGRTWSFNPGAFPEAHPSVPNHIVIDLAKRRATWRDGWENGSAVSLD